MKTTFRAALVIAALPFTQALAGSATAPALPQDRTGHWGGFYAGVNVGYGDLVPKIEDVAGRDASFGVHLGYDRDLGTTVLGAALERAQYDVSLGSGTETRRASRIKLRAGRDLGKTLVYVVAGPQRISLASGTRQGAFAGFGAAHKARGALVVGAEVLRHRFDADALAAPRIDATTLTVTLSLRF